MTAPPTSNHDEYAELVAGHVLHGLDEHDERHLADHLPQCPACRQLLAELSDTAAELAHAVHHPTPAGLDAAIRDGIRRTDPAPPDRAFRPRRMGRWAPLAAAASLLVLATAIVTWRDGRPGNPRTGLAGAEATLLCQRDPVCEPVLLASTDRASRVIALLRPTQASLLVEGLDANHTDREIYVLWQREPAGDMRAIATFDVPATTRGILGPFPLTTTPVRDALLAISREPGRTAPPRPGNPLLTSA